MVSSGSRRTSGPVPQRSTPAFLFQARGAWSASWVVPAGPPAQQQARTGRPSRRTASSRPRRAPRALMMASPRRPPRRGRRPARGARGAASPRRRRAAPRGGRARASPRAPSRAPVHLTAAGRSGVLQMGEPRTRRGPRGARRRSAGAARPGTSGPRTSPRRSPPRTRRRSPAPSPYLGAPREAFSYKMSRQEIVLVEAVLVEPRPLGRERRTKAERPPSYCIVLPEPVDGLRDGPGQFVVHLRQVGQPHGEKNAPPELLHREVVQIVS